MAINMSINVQVLVLVFIQIVLVAQIPQALSSSEDGLSLLHALNETVLNQDPDELHENLKCQAMSIPVCEGLNYNLTLLPNMFHHQTQQEVISDINLYHPLLKVNCSADLKLFLCTVYAPICFDHMNDGRPLSLLPCRSLCESARQGCAARISHYNMEWPVDLQCDKFPVKTPGVLCVQRDNDRPQVSKTSESLSGYQSRQVNSAITRDIGFVCPKNFEVPSYKLHLNGRIYQNCSLPCDDVLLDRHGTFIIRMTTIVLAIVCMIATILICLTFISQTDRFKYPMRPIIIIATCQFVVSACYLVGAASGNRIACNDAMDPPKNLPNLKMIRSVVVGNKKGDCTLIFMALYYFQMSSFMWWLMITISWYMIARLKWAPEAVSGVSLYFHLFSWTVPAFLTIYISVLGDIEGDTLTGTCYVSSSNQESIGKFVIIPMLACILIGLLFLVIGYVSLRGTRKVIEREFGQQTDEHDKLVRRIALFSIFFLLFSITLICYHLYEQTNLNSWMVSWLSNVCKIQDYSIPCPMKEMSNQAPHYLTFVVKYVATMAIGIVSAVFVISERTMVAYKEVAELCNYQISSEIRS